MQAALSYLEVLEMKGEAELSSLFKCARSFLSLLSLCLVTSRPAPPFLE